MYDGGKIIAGLIIFLVLISFPVWYNVAFGNASYVPDLPKVEGQEKCVEDTGYMRAYHMDLLNNWRDEVSRYGERIYTSKDGRKFEKSLTNTCLDCHKDREDFCIKCHDYVGVDTYCWDCHANPKGDL